MPNARSRWPSEEPRISPLASTSCPPGGPSCPLHYSNSGGLLASPASSVSALQHFAIFDSPSWFRPVVAPIGSGCTSAFGCAPVWGLLWNGWGKAGPAALTVQDFVL